MSEAGTHAEIWTAIATVAGVVATALFRMGQKWGTILALVQDLHRNQQVIANWGGIKLPHPYTEGKKRDDDSTMGGAATTSK